MATFTKFYDFVEKLGLAAMNLHTDTLKVMLTNTAPLSNTHTHFGSGGSPELADITNEHGYAPADIANTYTQTSGVGTLTATDVVFTASGGSFGPFRYVVIYDDTTVDKWLVGYADYGSAITVLTGETFTVDFGASLMTIT